MPLLPGTDIDRELQHDAHRGHVHHRRAAAWPHDAATASIMALSIAIGKIAISILSAFAIVYFRFPCRTLAFWMIFITLMLPVEVRIVPTFKVVADSAC